MAEQTMYHYTNTDGWKEILNGREGWIIQHPLTGKWVGSETLKGWMIPHRRLISEGIESSLVPSEATRPAIFGLTEPVPQTWQNYRDCINVWNYLLGCCKRQSELVLLKINLVEGDSPLVFDYIHIRRTAKDLSTMKGAEYKKRLAEGNRDYWSSQTPLSQYKGDFVLPEVVVFSPISQDRIEFLGERNRELLVGGQV
jgi:hypothetical protein